MTEIKLRRYQERAVENFNKWILTQDPLATITLPVGTGKTIVAASCLSYFPGKVFWIAHRSELIFQAFETIKKINPGINISIEMAERKADSNSQIVVGSVQTISRFRKHLDGFIPDLIIIDEYHHVSINNSTYNTIIKKFDKARILGLTATAWRTDGEPLPLGINLINMDVGTAVNKGYLVPPIAQPLQTETSLASVGNKMGDFDLKSLASTVNNENRNQLIANKALELIIKEKRQGIIFATDVAHSKAIFALLKDKVKAVEVYGETSIEERNKSVERIRNKEIDVIVNNMIFTEGTDFPHLSFAIMARPTKLLGLYIQAVGRVLRTSPGKTDAIIIDVYDKIKAKQSRSSFQDLAANGDLYGEKKRAVNVLTADVPVDDIAKSLINFPIFVKPEKNIRWQIDDETFPISSWQVNASQWLISWVAEIKIPKARSRAIWVPFDELPTQDIRGKLVRHDKFGEGTITEVLEKGSAPKVMVDFGWGTNRIMLIQSLQRQGHVIEHIADQFEFSKTERLFLVCVPEGTEKGRLLTFEKVGYRLLLKDDLRYTKDEIDTYLRNQANSDGNLQLVKSDAKWKKHPATNRQIEYIENLIDDGKISFDLDLASLTKGDVSGIIEQARWSSIICDKFSTDNKTKLLGFDLTTEDM